jgi:hypothetical protein
MWEDDGVLDLLADISLVRVPRGGGPRTHRTRETDGTDAASLDDCRGDEGRSSGRGPRSSCGSLCISYCNFANRTKVARLSF